MKIEKAKTLSMGDKKSCKDDDVREGLSSEFRLGGLGKASLR